MTDHIVLYKCVYSFIQMQLFPFNKSGNKTNTLKTGGRGDKRRKKLWNKRILLVDSTRCAYLALCSSASRIKSPTRYKSQHLPSWSEKIFIVSPSLRANSWLRVNRWPLHSWVWIFKRVVRVWVRFVCSRRINSRFTTRHRGLCLTVTVVYLCLCVFPESSWYLILPWFTTVKIFLWINCYSPLFHKWFSGLLPFFLLFDIK